MCLLPFAIILLIILFGVYIYFAVCLVLCCIVQCSVVSFVRVVRVVSRVLFSCLVLLCLLLLFVSSVHVGVSVFVVYVGSDPGLAFDLIVGRASHLGHWESWHFLVFGLWTLVFDRWSLDFGRQTLVFGFRTLVLVFGLWSLVFGLWSLVFGRWTFVFGLWSLRFRCGVVLSLGQFCSQKSAAFCSQKIRCLRIGRWLLVSVVLSVPLARPKQATVGTDKTKDTVG